MDQITVIINLSGQLLQQLQQYIAYMDEVDATMPEELQTGSIEIEIAILTLMKRGLDSFNCNLEKDKGGLPQC